MYDIVSEDFLCTRTLEVEGANAAEEATRVAKMASFMIDVISL